jgi:signal transduction histidine kinase
MLSAVRNSFAECEDSHRALTTLVDLLRASPGDVKVVVDVDNNWDIRTGYAPTVMPDAPRYPLGPHIPSDEVVVYGRTKWWSGKRQCVIYSAKTSEAGAVSNVSCESLAAALGADSFVSLPLPIADHSVARLHVGLRRGKPSRSDVRLFAQVSACAAVMFRAFESRDDAVGGTAILERKRISRDLHDSTIQPYVGLKLGLEALRRQCAPNDELARDIDELLQMTADNIGELRSYLGHLNRQSSHQQKITLLPSLRSQARRFSEYHGVAVHVIGNDDILVNRALFDEIMHITREALYNVRRHTASQSVTISVCVIDHDLVLEISNLNDARCPQVPTFRPRSIIDRAKDLGGSVSVEERQVGCTVVAIRIPL